MKSVPVLITLLSCLLCGCATSAPVTPENYRFASTQWTTLDICMLFSEKVIYLAEEKLRGVSKDDAMREWVNGKTGMHSLSADTVTKVYTDSFDNAGTYGILFFGQCAVENAQVSEVGLSKAQHCFAKAMIVHDVELTREQGKSKQEAYQDNAGLNPDMAKDIVENVYGLPEPKRGIELDAFGACIGAAPDWGAKVVPPAPFN
jgi:hypothetical protein